MDLTLTQRNAGLDDVIKTLESQAEVKYDRVVPSSHLRYANGLLVVVDGLDPTIDETGVGPAQPAALRPLDIFEDGIASRLEIPRGYLRRMREEGAIDLLDENVNHWLEDSDRNFFVRGFHTGNAGDIGVARALLSDKFLVVDHIDGLLAALDGIKATGMDIKITSIDLSERNLRMKVTAPAIRAAAPQFLGNYRSPFTGQTGADLPLIEAGLVVRNSETGNGAFTIVPQVTVLACTNGMTMTKEAVKKVHLGSQMEEGSVNWSMETRQKEVELIRARTTDAVTTFLSQDFLNRIADDLEFLGSRKLAKPIDAVDRICKDFRYTEAERASILDFFVRSGDTNASGIVQAVTAYAQTVEDPDRAAEFEDQAFDVLARAASIEV